eukprot:RCo024995
MSKATICACSVTVVGIAVLFLIPLVQNRHLFGVSATASKTLPTAQSASTERPNWTTLNTIRSPADFKLPTMVPPANLPTLCEMLPGGKPRSTPAKLYDVFPFIDEFDVLRIRLEELKTEVYTHILGESNVTYSGRPKPLWFKAAQGNFSAYKIQRVQPDMSRFISGNFWAREKGQRQLAAAAGLRDAEASDVVLVSDVDEIP